MLADEHPYKDPKHLEMLLRCNPWFSEGPFSFDWALDKADQASLVAGEPFRVDESVRAGQFGQDDESELTDLGLDMDGGTQ